MRGLLAIEPLYHQIVKGNKTQTRRSGGLDTVNVNPDEWEECGSQFVKNKFGVGIENVGFRKKEADCFVECKPRYKVGEVLYLKEPVSVNLDSSKNFYYYDLPYEHNYRDRKKYKWPNKLFMPANAARAFIQITGIKCERLLDISDEDCISEGIEQVGHWGDIVEYKNYGMAMEDNNYWYRPIKSFLSLFKFANKIKASAEIPNIWVWVYTFEYLPEYKIS